MKKELICITCPNSCHLTVEQEGGAMTVTGNTCPKGEEFARTELTHPMRTLTTTVKTAFPDFPYLPVRTAGVIPRESIPRVMAFLAAFEQKERVSCGNVIITNICETECDIIATATL